MHHSTHLWPSDVIWRLTLLQVMASCLTAPCHYMNQYWLIITEIKCFSPEDSFTGNVFILDMSLQIINLRLQLYHAGTNESISTVPLQWRHNERNGVLNHRRLHYLLICWFRRRAKKTSKLRVPGLCAENSPVTGEFPTQKANNAQNVFISWRHHASQETARRFTPCCIFLWFVKSG